MWHVISETMKIYVYGIPHMWILKYDTSEFILEIETDSEIWKTNLWSPKGKGWGTGWIGSLELAGTNYYI